MYVSCSSNVVNIIMKSCNSTFYNLISSTMHMDLSGISKYIYIRVDTYLLYIIQKVPLIIYSRQQYIWIYQRQFQPFFLSVKRLLHLSMIIICMQMYIYIDVHIHEYIYIWIYQRQFQPFFLSVKRLLHLSIILCMYIYIYTYACISIYRCINIDVQIHKYIFIFIYHINTYMFICVYVYESMHVYMYKYLHIYLQIHIYTWLYEWNLFPFIHVYIYIYIYIYIHVYVHKYMCKPFTRHKSGSTSSAPSIETSNLLLSFNVTRGIFKLRAYQEFIYMINFNIILKHVINFNIALQT
jgi:hypothetical protein